MSFVKIFALVIGAIVGVATANKTTEEVEAAWSKVNEKMARRNEDNTVESTAEEVEE